MSIARPKTRANSDSGSGTTRISASLTCADSRLCVLNIRPS